MSFSGTDPNDPTATAAEPFLQLPDTLITNDGFFPTISFHDFIRVTRINREYRVETIIHHLRLAIMRANRDLAACKAQWQQAGHESLEEVPDNGCLAAELDGTTALELNYKEAVYCWAKRELMFAYATMNRKDQAANAGKESEDTGDRLQHRYIFAINHLKCLQGRVVTSVI